MKRLYFTGIKGMASLMLMASVLASCSSDEVATTQPTTTTSSITINQPGYDADNTTTRSTKLSKDTVITLGDDIEAEVHIESVAEVATRATGDAAPSAYTLAAYQAGKLVKKVAGTVSGTAFTPESEFTLEPGTYDFVAYNSGITASADGSQLTVKRADAEVARLAEAKAQTVTAGSPLNLALTAKHVGSRINLQLIALMNFTETTATLGNNADIPMTGTYSVATGTWNYTKGNLDTPLAQHFAATTKGDPLSDYDTSNGKANGTLFGTGSMTYTDPATNVQANAKDYQYFLPTTNSNNITLTFLSGELYHTPLATKSVSLSTKELAANGSYVIQVKLNRLFKYVFNDGSVGSLKEKGTRTPIALVIDENERIAVALGEGPNVASWATSGTGTDAKHIVANISDGVGVYNGYDETWNADYSKTGVVRADSTKFTAFHSAVTYMADYLKAKGVTLSNGMGEGTHRWYLPSIGEVILFYNNIGYSGLTAANVNSAFGIGKVLPWYGQGMERQAFTAAGVGGAVPAQRWYTSTATSQVGGGAAGADRVYHTWTQNVQNTTAYRNQINLNSASYASAPGNPCTARAFIRY